MPSMGRPRLSRLWSKKCDRGEMGSRSMSEVGDVTNLSLGVIIGELAMGETGLNAPAAPR